VTLDRANAPGPRILDSFGLESGGARESRVIRAAGFPPESTPWVVTSESFLPAGYWTGYRVEIVAVQVMESPEVDQSGWMVAPITMPDGTSIAWFLRFARARLFYAVAPAFLQVRWRQGQRSKLELRGNLDDLTAQEWAQLGRGRQLLRRVVCPQTGRPADDGAVFIRSVDAAWDRLHVNGRPPTQEQIADSLGKDPDHFRKLRRKHLRVTWAQYCAGRLGSGAEPVNRMD